MGPLSFLFCFAFSTYRQLRFGQKYDATMHPARQPTSQQRRNSALTWHFNLRPFPFFPAPLVRVRVGYVCSRTHAGADSPLSFPPPPADALPSPSSRLQGNRVIIPQRASNAASTCLAKYCSYPPTCLALAPLSTPLRILFRYPLFRRSLGQGRHGTFCSYVLCISLFEQTVTVVCPLPRSCPPDKDF